MVDDIYKGVPRLDKSGKVEGLEVEVKVMEADLDALLGKENLPTWSEDETRAIAKEVHDAIQAAVAKFPGAHLGVKIGSAGPHGFNIDIYITPYDLNKEAKAFRERLLKMVTENEEEDEIGDVKGHG